MDSHLANSTELHEKPISIMRKESSLIDSASIAENIFIYKKHHKNSILVPWNLLYKQADLHLKELELNRTDVTKVGDLSPFERRIIELIRAHLSGVKLLIIDELMDNLTLKEYEQVRRLMDLLTANGAAVLIVDTYLPRLERYTDQLAILDHGYIQSFPRFDGWINHYLENLKLPVASENLGNSNEIAFQVSDLSVGDNYKPVSFCLYRGQLTVICDWGYGINRRLIHCLFLETNHASIEYALPSRVRLLDTQVDQYLAEDLSPLDNLCLGHYRKLSRLGVVSLRRLQFIKDEFNAWYGDSSLLEKRSVRDLTELERFALLLFRFVIEGAQVIFFTDPRIWQNYSACVHLMTMLRCIVNEKHLSICMLTSESNRGDSFFDREIMLSEHIAP